MNDTTVSGIQINSLWKTNSLADNSRVEKVKSQKHNFVIIWFGDLWKWWHQLLTEAGQNVYVCSLNGRAYTDPYSIEHKVHCHNAFNLPIAYEDVDVVLICCTARDLDMLHNCLPIELIKEKASRMVFFQNGIGIREKIKQILLNTPHPTQVIPYFSFKTNWGNKVDISLAKPCPTTWEKDVINILTETLNIWPHQNHWFEWMDSIILRKEERKKGYINTFINTISVIYKAPTQKALDMFLSEFWPGAKEEIYKELLQFNNNIAGDELAHMEINEIREDIENALTKFATKYPSTYYQYYKNPKINGTIHSDEEHFIGRIISNCDYCKKDLPLLRKLYNRMMGIKKQIEQWN